MIFRKHSIVTLGLFSALALSLFAPPSWADLEQYIQKPEAEFGWKLRKKIESERTGDRIYDLHFVSQTWQGNAWQHQLQIYQPLNVAPNSTMFLWVTGGSARPTYVSLGLELARKINAPVGILLQISN